MEHRLSFSCDYLEGAHPAILQRLCETNFAQTAGYGTDEYCESAREKIRAACGAPNAEIHFLVGGTQTNATVIDALLRSYEGVIAADTGHISVHEAGAIEFGGHKVLTLPQENGKITASQIRALLDQYEDDANRDHTVMPGMVYLSQPTEYGTLYSKKELAAISALCREKRLPLYIDGARLAYALACPENDVTLRDLAALCDIFYIGGTKCGALLGEAVVIPQPGLIPHFFTSSSSTARCSPRDGCSASSSTRSLPMGSTSASAQTPFATPTLSGARWRKTAICPVSPPRRTRASASSVSSSTKSSPSAWTSPSGSNMTRRTASSALPQAGRRGKRM